jgi:hypothetical protein
MAGAQIMDAEAARMKSLALLRVQLAMTSSVEGEQLCVPTAALSELVLARAVAFRALDPQHDELVD